MPKRDPWPLLIFCAIALGLYIYGCRQLSNIVRARQARTCVPLPELHESKVLGSGVVRKDVSRSTRVTLAWSNSTSCFTGIEATSDFTNWQVLTKFYARAGEVTVTLSNRPSQEFYRAFNAAF